MRLSKAPNNCFPVNEPAQKLMLNLEKILFELFGFRNFKEGQREIIESILSGYPTLAILPTGGGKSLCYQLPAMIAEKPSIVISPMISLMKDQTDKLNKKRKTAGFVNSAQSYRESETVLREALEGKLKLLYLSPEKISSPGFLARLKEAEWEYLFVDEAHCISEWGHNFRPSYRKIGDFARELGFDVISAFTATATPEVRRDIALQLGMENPKIFVRGFERPNLALNVLKPKDKKSKLAAILRSGKLPAVVYCATRKETEETADFLRLHGFAVNHYHAGLSSEMRKLVQDDFIANRLEVIVATNAFGMGIDKSDIRTVVHYNIPASLEHYYQEIGRAGRDGEKSDVYLFYSKRDFAIHEYLIEISYPTEDEIRAVYAGLNDYLRVALGMNYETAVPVDKSFLKFFETQNIGKAKLENALKTLENSGYVKLTQPIADEYKIRYLLSPPDLKVYIKKIAKKEYAEILVALARNYLSAPFSSLTKISPHKLANLLSTPAEQIIEKLRELDLLGVLKFEEPQNFLTVRLLTTRVRARDLQISNDKIEKLVKHALDKLNLVKKYAETDSCRMDFILRYFGENKNYRCGICDNCAFTHSSSREELDYLEEIVSDVLRSLSENVTPNELFDFLTGKKRTSAFAGVSGYGSLNAYSKIEIDEALENLIEKKKAKLAEGKIVAEKQTESLQKRNADYETDLRLFNKLTELRKETARKFNQPVYMICGDEILRAIVRAKPQNEFELLAIKGFSRTLFNKFGEETLELIRTFLKEEK